MISCEKETRKRLTVAGDVIKKYLLVTCKISEFVKRVMSWAN